MDKFSHWVTFKWVNNILDQTFKAQGVFSLIMKHPSQTDTCEDMLSHMTATERTAEKTPRDSKTRKQNLERAVLEKDNSWTMNTKRTAGSQAIEN